MMSLFSTPYSYGPSDVSFAPLFRLLDDFECYNQEAQVAPRKTQRRAPATRVLPTFRPSFDVRETEKTYELHGELPGLQRENLQLEFTDPQTLLVRGRVERTYENKPEEPEPTEQPQHDKPEGGEPEPKKRRNSHQATVEDDPEEPSTPTSNTPTPPETPKTQVAKPAPQEVQKVPAQQQPQERYWAYERSVGEFSRTFTFPSRIEHDNVSASLNNGILTVSVPKAKKHEVRKIAIN